jgi:hypothetical protein
MRYAVPGLKEDRVFVLEVMQQDWRTVVYAGPGLKEDRAFMLRAWILEPQKSALTFNFAKWFHKQQVRTMKCVSRNLCLLLAKLR